MKLSDFRLAAKLGAAFLVVVTLTAGVGFVSVSQLARINSDTEDIAGNRLPSIEALANLRNSLNEFRRTESLHVLAPGDVEMATQEQRMGDIKKRIATMLASYEAHIRTPEERRLRDEFTGRLDGYYARNARLIQLSAGEGKLAQTKQYFREDSDVALGEAGKSIAALIDYNVKGADDAHETAQAAYAQARAWVMGIVAGAMLVAALLAIGLTRLITRPVARAVDAAERIAAGDLTIELVAHGKDETARLLQALCGMKDNLSRLVSGIRQNAEGVASASTQIAQGNSDLSSRTEEQASALEETAASMEQLGATVKQNADNARQANQLALSASSVAIRGGEVVDQVVGTMKDINDSSKRIADILGVIDGIAFQTNILALNAAVEAARAGEQGRGFAVVAGEVRSLAQRSAEAAKEIKSLINDSVERVDKGSALVDQAGVTMAEIVSSIRRVTDIMGEISAASTEQSAGVAQVGEAVSQMDQATQQNAALVEESAAAADSLSQQARGLVQAVAVFKLAGDETVARDEARVKDGAHVGGRAHAAVEVRVMGKPHDMDQAKVVGQAPATDGAAREAPAAIGGYAGTERRSPNRARNVARLDFKVARPALNATQPAFGRRSAASTPNARATQTESTLVAVPASSGKDWESF